jgi:hypothetical protein
LCPPQLKHSSIVKEDIGFLTGITAFTTNDVLIPLEKNCVITKACIIIPDYAESRNFYETKKGLLWVYGTNALYNYDQNEKRFYYYEHDAGSPTGIQFRTVYQVMEDHDGSIWLATDNGLYFTSPGSGTYGVVDMLFDSEKGGLEFTDILELKSGGYWLSTWGRASILCRRI